MMIKKEFEDFLDKQLYQKKERKSEWEETKNKWVKNIDIFYASIERLLEKYIQSGKISTKYINYTVYEENIGAYDTKKLILTLGQQQVYFTPIGRLIIGAEGRIDMEGTLGKVRFIYTKNTSKDEVVSPIFLEEGKDNIPASWKISTPPPQLHYIDINEESFLDALMEIVNG